MEFKLGLLVPSNARNSHFVMLGLSGCVNSIEAVGSLFGKPLIRLLASFLIYVTTLPDFWLRVSC